MRSVEWDAGASAVRLIDQRALPHELRYLTLTSLTSLIEAIRSMAVRGAPAIGACGAFGLAMFAQRSTASDPAELWSELESACREIEAARPTASNLSWALMRVLQAAHAQVEAGDAAMRAAILDEAQALADEDIRVNRAIGRIGATLLPQDATVIHHCNTGALATVDYGTALGIIRTAHEAGKSPHVLVDETRPRLQGSRLTAWELQEYGIPFEIIPDSAAGLFLSQGIVDAVLVGTDRVAANGDVANKIGTYMLALAANDNDVPFYVGLPTSTLDLATETGADIPIEERSAEEVLAIEVGGRQAAPEGSHARNPAFDITPARLVTAFVTEVGVVRPPFRDTLASAKQGRNPARTGKPDYGAL